MRGVILVAPDAFKGTHRAEEVAAAIGVGVRAVGGAVDLCPVADGGEGTMAILLGVLGGSVVEVDVHDPLGRPLRAPFGLVDGGAIAIVDVAAASGLALLAPDERDAEAASTFGTGELIAAAVAAGARRVIVAVGGSATTDGGAGAIDAIERAGGLGGATLVALCDAHIAFEQAPSVFGPQKGADPAAVARLERRLDEQARRLPRDPRGVALTGGAGGLSGGLWSVYRAQLHSGAEWVLDAVGFDARLVRAHAVIAGEGRLDEQTRRGKIVGRVAARCSAAGVPVHAIVGSSALDAAAARELGLTDVRIASTLDELARAGAEVARLVGA
jgi:glycerate kinase